MYILNSNMEPEKGPFVGLVSSFKGPFPGSMLLFRVLSWPLTQWLISKTTADIDMDLDRVRDIDMHIDIDIDIQWTPQSWNIHVG